MCCMKTLLVSISYVYLSSPRSRCQCGHRLNMLYVRRFSQADLQLARCDINNSYQKANKEEPMQLWPTRTCWMRHSRCIGVGVYGVFNRELNKSVSSHNSLIMMTSSNGNIFRVTGHLCGEFTGPRWIRHTKASDAEPWCFLWSASE